MNRWRSPPGAHEVTAANLEAYIGRRAEHRVRTSVHHRTAISDRHGFFGPGTPQTGKIGRLSTGLGKDSTIPSRRGTPAVEGFRSGRCGCGTEGNSPMLGTAVLLVRAQHFGPHNIVLAGVGFPKC